MKSFTWMLLLAAVVVAQDKPAPNNQPAGSSNNATNPLIPSAASAKCKSYLDSFNTDKNVQACITPLISATSKFQPSASGSASQSDVTSALSTICAASASCKQADIQQAVSAFYSNCKEELTAPGSDNNSIRTTFDLLYMVIPLRDTICTKDDSGAYCLSKAKKHDLPHSKRQSGQVTLQQIDVPSWKSSHLHYLFMRPDASAEDLCTKCTHNVLTAYVTFENLVPYPMGITNSFILSDQKTLWKAISEKCTPDFLDNVLKVANAAPSVGGADANSATGIRLSFTSLLGMAAALAATLV